MAQDEFKFALEALEKGIHLNVYKSQNEDHDNTRLGFTIFIGSKGIVCRSAKDIKRDTNLISDSFNAVESKSDEKDDKDRQPTVNTVQRGTHHFKSWTCN
jgi:hypothetical protein